MASAGSPSLGEKDTRVSSWEQLTSSSPPLPLPPSPLQPPPTKALLLEDTSTEMKVATMLLGKAGYEVTGAANGEEGLEAMHNREFDLVLCDSEMPVMNGPEFVRRWREVEVRDGVAQRRFICAVTSLLEDAVPWKDVGYNMYMHKPLTKAKLASIIQANGECMRTEQSESKKDASLVDEFGHRARLH